MAASTEKVSSTAASTTYSSAASTGSSSMAASTRQFEDSVQLMAKETSESSTPSLTIGGGGTSRIFVAGIEQEPVPEEKPRYFQNTDGGYLMRIREKAQKLETERLDIFYRFICMGKAMIDYASQGDITNFKRLLAEADDKELMFWHVTKGFKAAVKNKHVELVRFLIDDLRLSLDHEAFQKYLHLFLFGCQEADLLETPEKREEAHRINRELLRLLSRGKGKHAIDETDNANNSTPLMVACESLSDLQLVKILVEEGGAEVNSVNSDDKMPLSLLKERIDRLISIGAPDEAPETEHLTTELGKLKQIFDYLESRGANLTWRDKRK